MFYGVGVYTLTSYVYFVHMQQLIIIYFVPFSCAFLSYVVEYIGTGVDYKWYAMDGVT